MRTMATQILSPANRVEKTGINNRYRAQPITETLTNGFFTVDQTWAVKSWNNAAEKLLGVPTKDIIGRNLWEEFADFVPIEFYAVYHKAFLHEIQCHFKEYW